jgi:hypothetical protein
MTPFTVYGRYPEFDESDIKEWKERSNLAKDIRKEIRPKLKITINESK